MSTEAAPAMVQTLIRTEWKIRKVMDLLAKSGKPFSFIPMGEEKIGDEMVPVARFDHPDDMVKEIGKWSRPQLLTSFQIDFHDAMMEIMDGIRNSVEDDTDAGLSLLNDGNYPMNWHKREEVGDEADFAYAEVYDEDPDTIHVYWTQGENELDNYIDKRDD